MAIGDRVAGRSPAKQYSRQSADPSAFGAGVATALTSLSRGVEEFSLSLEDMQATVRGRVEKTEDFDAERRYIEYIGAQNREQAERVRSSAENAAGITNLTEEQVQQSSQAFLQTLPERLRPEYLNKVTTFREQAVTSAFNYEYEAGNQKFVKDVNVSMNTEASEVLLGNKSAEEAFANVTGLIGRSDLTEAAKRDLTDQAQSFLLKAEFQKEVEYSREFRGTVTPKTEGDVVAAGLLPHERGILNAISKPESSDRYDVMYGGGKITDFADHPRQYITITTGPNKGQKSSAAGKYQFLASTWDATVQSYNAENPQAPIKDFSPESQDRIALFYARRIYNKQLGAGEMNFDQVLQSGNRGLIKSMKRALWDDKGGWEGFRHMSDDEFANTIMGSNGIAGGGTGTPQDPDIWNNPRYASLSFEQKNTLANSADASSSERDREAAAQLLAQQKAQTNSLMMNAMDGKYSLADEGMLVKQGMLTTVEDRNKWKGLVEEATRGQADAARITSALANGRPLYPESDDKGLNRMLGQKGLDAVREADAEFATNTLIPLAVQGGFFPSDTGKLLSNMVEGSSGKDREYATSVLANAMASDPRILDRSPGISESAKKQVMLAQSLRGLYTPEEIAEKLRNYNDPTQQAGLETARTAAKKMFGDNYDVNDVVGAFDTYMPGDAPSVPLARSQSDALMLDYQTAFVEGFVISGDEGAAEDYANKLVQRHWAPTEIGGDRRLSKFAPETFYPTIEGKHDWLDMQARDELGFTDDTVFQLMPDAQTENEGRRYAGTADKAGMSNASYQVAYLNEQGYPEIMRGEDGNPLRWAGEITPEIKERVAKAAQYRQLTTEAQRLLGQLAADGGSDADNARFREVNEQLSEIQSQDPYGDPTRVVPKTTASSVRTERDALQSQLDAFAEEQSVVDKLSPNGGMSFSGNADKVNKLQRRIDALNKKLGDN